MKKLTEIYIFSIALALSGCGGGGDVTLITPILTSEQGIWLGGFLRPGGGGATISLGLIQDGRFLAIEGELGNPCRIYSGSYDSQLKGTIVHYVGTATNVNGNNASAACPDGDLGDGRVEPSTSFNPNPVNIDITMFRTLNIQVGSPNRLMVLQPLTDVYERPSSRDLVTGTWNYGLDGNPPYNLPLEITPSGNNSLAIAGTDTFGCIYAGRMELHDPERNMYFIEDLTLVEQVGSQPGQGCVGYQTIGNERYIGLATFMDAYVSGPGATTTNLLGMLVASPTHAFFLTLQKGS